MIDRRDRALRPGELLRASRSVTREMPLDQHKTALAARDLSVDRAALTRFIIVLTILFVAYLAIGPSASEDEWGFVNAVGPIVLCLAALWTGYKIIAANPRTIWTPMPWFALSTAIYYGLGPLLYFFGTAETIAYVDGFWPVGPEDLWRTNLLNTVSLLTISTVFLAADKLLKTGRSIDRTGLYTVASGDPARTAAFVFLGVGLPLRYLLVLPYRFGQLGFALPGSLYTLNSLVYLGLFMLAYLGAKRGGLWKCGFWLLFVMETISNLVVCSKLDLLLVFIMIALGRFQARRNVKELAFAGIAIFVIYLLLSPLMAWQRIELAREYGHFGVAPIDARLSVTARGLELWSRGALDVEHSEQGWWSRICYAHMQTACMHLYDSGVVGDSFAFALYGWVPRYLWPDKPIMNLGQQFTLFVRGIDNATGAGAFGEAYWNGGWLMVVLACGYIGVLFAWLSRTALTMLARSEWLLLPCAFIGIWDGLRIDDWFAPTYVTGFILYLVYYFLIRLVMDHGQKER
jgi:hypothetical protein